MSEQKVATHINANIDFKQKKGSTNPFKVMEKKKKKKKQISFFNALSRLLLAMYFA